MPALYLTKSREVLKLETCARAKNVRLVTLFKNYIWDSSEILFRSKTASSRGKTLSNWPEYFRIFSSDDYWEYVCHLKSNKNLEEICKSLTTILPYKTIALKCITIWKTPFDAFCGSGSVKSNVVPVIGARNDNSSFFKGYYYYEHIRPDTSKP